MKNKKMPDVKSKGIWNMTISIPKVKKATVFRPDAPALIPMYKLVCGKNPDPKRQDFDGAWVAKVYQREAFSLLRNKRFGIIKQPTGSGKSWLLLGLVWDFINNNHNAKAIIIAPQIQIINGSFNFNDTLEPKKVRFGNKNGEDIVQFRPFPKFASDNSDTPIKWLVDFIITKLNSFSERICVCTQQALAAAFKEVRRMFPNAWEKYWKNISLYVDEAHHGKCSAADFNQEDFDAYNRQLEDYDKKINNSLGKIFKFFIEKNAGRLVLVTATFMRSDFMAVVDKKWTTGKKAQFTIFELAVSRYLDSMSVLKYIRLCFLVGRPECAINYVCNRNLLSIVYTPRTTSPLCDGYFFSTGDKKEIVSRKTNMISRYFKAAGKVVGREKNTTIIQTKNGKKIRALDLVTEKEREQKSVWMREMINKQGRGDPVPDMFDIIFAMGMCIEGWDCPKLEQALVIGPRMSMVTTAQLLGRGLRDDKENFDFIVNLPANDKPKDPEVVDEWVERNLKAIVQFLALGTVASVPPYKPEQTDAEKAAYAEMRDLQKNVKLYYATMTGVNGHVDDVAGIVKAALNKTNKNMSDDSKDIVARYCENILKTQTREMRAVLKDIDLGEIEKKDDLDGLRFIAWRLTGRKLGNINRTHGGLLTEEMIVEWMRAHDYGTS